MWGYGESGQLAGGSIQGGTEGELIGESFTTPENIDLKGRCVLMAGAGNSFYFIGIDFFRWTALCIFDSKKGRRLINISK